MFATRRACQRFIYLYVQGAYDKFQGFFGMDTFIDSTHIKL